YLQQCPTQYQYDGAGLITKITYPSGREVSYTRDLAGDVIEVATTQAGTTTSLASQIERAPFGPVTSMVRWNGISESRSLDLNYRVTGIDATRVHSLVYRYTPDSLISAIDDNLSSSVNQSLGYDAVGRITSAEGLYGVLGYGYDATGNRTSITTDGLSQSYTINYMNNWLVKTGQTSRSYDANGNLTKQGADTFTYDSQNRLVAATVAGVTAAYTYNHLDQRVTKTLNGQTRLLIYGLAGNLIEELDAATGDVLAEYIWLDGTPLSFAQSGQTYQVHVDHLGTPKALTDASGQVVWKASYSPFGKASITTQGPTFNLRFPGQYYDAETGLHYNWRRYYDPNTGRYITSDPIGLAGGINTYAYALSNPIGNADPTGEFVPLLLGAYVAIDFALSAWDAYDTFKTITSDCATSREKWISGGLFAAGIILPGNYKALGNVAERAFKNTADDFVDLASSQRRKHILDGDATGGGHRAGTGKPGKSEFPQSWSDEKIMHVISDIATDPNVSRKAGRGGRTIAEAVKEGINVRVIQESNGDIVSGFPTNVPRNPK
ncbi:RHS repeat-associated core domain-containing protein, partial [Escherichia coli]|uniref:RHS repeat-associated core domain-containing protein n=1 Tax=Escherichia coli TaxID=562 RepID=UPI001495A96E